MIDNNKNTCFFKKNILKFYKLHIKELKLCLSWRYLIELKSIL